MDYHEGYGLLQYQALNRINANLRSVGQLVGPAPAPVALADALDRVIARCVEVAPKAAALEALANTRVEAAG